jgi:hypothetical protein
VDHDAASDCPVNQIRVLNSDDTAMAKKHQATPVERVNTAAEAYLTAEGQVSPLDVLVGLGWLDPGALGRWRRGQIDFLERAVQPNPPRVMEAMRLLREWATEKGLSPSESHYVARTPGRQTLRFSPNDDPAIEQFYRMRWISSALSEKTRERLAEKASRPPELLVIQPLNSEWTCHRCGGTGSLRIMESPGPACMRCAGLDDLEFLAAGNALLSRRAKARSTRCAVVVRFSKNRRRYERQGLLVEPGALADVQRELEA